MLNATWISAITQPCALFIGLTNKVQPYCRLAIITMQMMPASSWSQRVDGGRAAAVAELDDISSILP